MEGLRASAGGMESVGGGVVWYGVLLLISVFTLLFGFLVFVCIFVGVE